MPSLTAADLASRTQPMAKKWIKKATSGAHGQFRAKAEKAGETTKQFAKQHEGDSGKTGAQARLAENLMGLKHGTREHRRATLYDKQKD